MPLSNLRACLTLGALLCALPGLAAPPAAPAVSGMQWQKLVLQHTLPGDVLKALHWDQPAGLPTGVTDIHALQRGNSLLIRATPAGFVRVQRAVNALDVAPRQVQIRFALVRATDADLKASGIDLDSIPLLLPAPASQMGYATGSGVARFLQTLTGRGAVLLQSPDVTTTDGVQAALDISGGQPIPTLPKVESFTFAVTPHVNSNGSVTLALHPQATWRVTGKANPDGIPATTTRSLDASRTVRNGDTLVFTNLFPGAAGVGDSQLLLFVTPTLVTGENGPASAPKK